MNIIQKKHNLRHSLCRTTRHLPSSQTNDAQFTPLPQFQDMEIEQKRRQDEYNASVQNLYTRANIGQMKMFLN